MGKKKSRAFFICPRWSELWDAHNGKVATTTALVRIHEKTLAAIKEGRPLARSTLRKALLTACQAWGTIFDVDAYLVDKRTIHSPPLKRRQS